MNIAVCSPHTADTERLLALLEGALDKYAINKEFLHVEHFAGTDALLEHETDYAFLFLGVSAPGAKECAAAALLKSRLPAPVICFVADT